MAVSAELLRESTTTTPPREGGPVRHADDEWFNRLFVDYEPRVRRFVHGFTRPDHVVDDVVQEVFIRAHRVRAEFPEGDPWPLLVTIARRASIDMHRRRAVRGECPTKPEILEGRRVSIGDLVGGPESLVVPTGQAAHVAEALDRMDPRYRRILVLKHVEGFKYQELADAEGLSLDAIKCALRRARHSFKQTYLALVRSRGFEAVFGPVLVPIARRLRAIRDRVAASPAVQGAVNVAMSVPAAVSSVVAIAALGVMSLGGIAFGDPAAPPALGASVRTPITSAVEAVTDDPGVAGTGGGPGSTVAVEPASYRLIVTVEPPVESPAASASGSSTPPNDVSVQVASDDVVPVEDPPASGSAKGGAGSGGVGLVNDVSVDNDLDGDPDGGTAGGAALDCSSSEHQGNVTKAACSGLSAVDEASSLESDPSSPTGDGEPLPEPTL